MQKRPHPPLARSPFPKGEGKTVAPLNKNLPFSLISCKKPLAKFRTSLFDKALVGDRTAYAGSGAVAGAVLSGTMAACQ